jgi:hypothetical protein
MKYYTTSRHRFDRQNKPTYARDASRVASKGSPLDRLSFDSLPNDCCVYRDSRCCACELSAIHMNQPHTTDAGGIDE